MSTIRVPLLGNISTGIPLLVPAADFATFDVSQFIEISANLLPAGTDLRELFALEVRGNGLVDAGLNDCDIVVLRAVQDFADGDIVAVWLPERGEAALTRLYRDGEGYRLQAANAAMRPILIRAGQSLEVKGKVVAMIRTIRD